MVMMLKSIPCVLDCLEDQNNNCFYGIYKYKSTNIIFFEGFKRKKQLKHLFALIAFELIPFKKIHYIFF